MEHSTRLLEYRRAISYTVQSQENFCPLLGKGYFKILIHSFFTWKIEIKIPSSFAETGLTQWIEHRPEDWKVPGSIPVKGMYLGCGDGVQEAADQWFSLIDVSNSLSLSLPLC